MSGGPLSNPSLAPGTPGTPGTPTLRLGNYEPLLELASGGMAVVYAARQLGAAGFERLVVVKRVHRHLLGNKDFFNMFRDEARVAALIHHPNVVAVSDVVEAEGELLLVMEYVEGSSLSTLRGSAREANLPFPIPVAARIAADTLAGLQAAHDAVDMRGNKLDLVHRDVSPQNILVGVDGSSRVIDFGIAKARHRLTETKSGSLKGKYSYMAPEQTRGMDVDRRTDIFAWGVVLHEMLTGERLFRGENEFDTMRRIWEMPIPNPSSVNPAVPPALDAVVHRALARDVAVRYATAHEALDALEKAVAVGSARDVAAFVERVAGERHRERRRALHGMLEGRVAPLALELPLDKDDSQTTLSPQSHSQIPTAYGSEANVAVAQKTIVEVPRARNQVPVVILLVAGVGSVALVAAVIVVFLFAFRPTSHTTVASTTMSSAVTAPTESITVPSIELPPGDPAASATPNATAANSLAPGEVTLTMHAPASILSVHAPGSHRVEIQGKTAMIVMAPWTDALRVDAVLEGNKKASAKVAKGATSADLLVAGPKNVTGTSPTRDPNLQANPY